MGCTGNVHGLKTFTQGVYLFRSVVKLFVESPAHILSISIHFLVTVLYELSHTAIPGLRRINDINDANAAVSPRSKILFRSR